MGKSPQTEDGFTRIANELFDAILSAKLTHRQQSVALAVIRKTYGYNKKEDDISASQIGDLCGMSRTHVTTTLNELAEKNVITKKPGVYGSIIGIQKDYSKWCLGSTKSVHVYQIGTSTKSVQGVPNQAATSTESVQVDSTKSVHTKDNLPKDNKQKKERKREKTISLSDFLVECEKNGERPIPHDDPVFKYAEEIGLPVDFLQLGWIEFKNQKTLNGAKHQKDWRQTFRVYVRKNWLGIWRVDRKTGGYVLTDAGFQAKRLYEAAA